MEVAQAATVPAGLSLDGRETHDASTTTSVTWIISRWLAWVERPVPSYLLLALLQLRVIWGDWYLRDITTGDTQAYFVSAARWADSLLVNLAWSPLYTAYLGTLLKI